MTQPGTNESDVGPDPRGRTGPPVGGNAQQAAGEGVPVPPYEGRTTADARVSADDEPEERLRRAEGVHPGSVTEALTDPATSPHGQPAADETVTRGSDPGTGPAHYPGTPRAEDVGETKEPGRAETETQGASRRPTGESSGRDATSVDPGTVDEGT